MQGSNLCLPQHLGSITLPASPHPSALSSSRLKPGWAIQGEILSGSTCMGQSGQIHGIGEWKVIAKGWEEGEMGSY